MGKSRRKSRKHKGGNPQPTTAPAKMSPTQTACGGSLAAVTLCGAKQQKTQAEGMTEANKNLASGGGKRKKGGAAKIICPQPAAGSGGSIGAGGSSAGKNMCNGVKHTLQTQSNATYDDAAKNLSTAPPQDPFKGQSGGGRNIYIPERFRRSRRRSRRRRRRRKSKRKTKRKTKRKKRRGRKSRRHRY